MYSRNSFGCYYPVDSSIHRMNAIVKITNFIIMLLLVVLCNFLSIHLFMIALVIVMMMLSFVPLRFYFKTLWSLRYIYLIIAFAASYYGADLELAVVFILKLIIVVEYLNVIVYTTSPSEMCYGIEKTLSVFNIFLLPINKAALGFTNAIRFVPLLLTVENKTLKSQASRGIDYYHSDIFGRMYAVCNVLRNTLYLTFKRMKAISFSAEVKMFSVNRRRTNYRTNKPGLYDLIFVLFHIILIIGFLVEKGLVQWNI